MDTFSVLNYQGSKRALLDFIHVNTKELITPNTTILDIFSGTCSVGYSFKKTNKIIANDSEYYAYIISNALLKSYYVDIEQTIKSLKEYYYQNMAIQRKLYLDLGSKEKQLLSTSSTEELINIYNNIPTIWNDSFTNFQQHNCYELFTTYYSGTYFGIEQAMDIDSLRYAIEKYKGNSIFFVLLTSLFYAMKECVFSKDGHMAQPLEISKNKKKLINVRKKSIFNLFFEKVLEFYSNTFINSKYDNKVFNLNFRDLLSNSEIQKEVTFIYADPPYTDMQYSRYYHLLNIVSLYNYPKPTINNGAFTKGLYVEGRYQSKLSLKSSCLSEFLNLIKFANEKHKNLAISFAYPENLQEQKTDRYVMSIENLIKSCTNEFTSKNVEVVSLNYQHSNNRNSQQKKVLEYLILCKGL